MKKQRIALLLAASMLSTLLLHRSAAAEILRPKLNYACTFEYPMPNPYPEYLRDPASDGIFHITSTVTTKKKNGRRSYHLLINKKWPIVEPNTSATESEPRLVHRENTKRYALDALRLYAPLRKTVTAEIRLANPELYIGGACSSCTSYFKGSCTKIEPTA